MSKFAIKNEGSMVGGLGLVVRYIIKIRNCSKKTCLNSKVRTM